MRLVCSIICFLFITNLSATKKYDAEYLVHETHESFHYEHNSYGVKQFVQEVEVHRRIQIKSQYGIERYNRLYVPTYEDLDFRSIVYELTAKTIKAGGEIIELDKSAIRKTTLPGNNPFLRNYEGSVELVAFPQVDIGDIVEYTYKVRYISDFSKDYEDIFKREMIEEIPIATYSRTITLEDRLYVRLLEFNLSSSYMLENVDGAKKYSWNFTNIAPLESEIYGHDYTSMPHISMLITTYKMKLSKSWEKLLRKMDDHPKGNYKFTSDVSLDDLVRLAKKRTTIKDKVRLICDTIYEWQRDIHFENHRLNRWYRNTKYLAVLKKVGINASLIEMRPLSEGPFDEELISFSQFDKALIEFEDENGELHYIMPNEPFVNIDYIPFNYQGSRAIRIRDLLNQAGMEGYTMPYSTADVRQSFDERSISLIVENDSLIYDMEVKRKTIGHPFFTYDACFVNKSDSALRARASESLDESIFNRQSIRIENSEWNGGVIDYYTGEIEVSTSCQGKEKFDNMHGNIPLWRLVDLEEFDNFLGDIKVNKQRKFDAHISSAYSSETIILLSSSTSNLLMANEFMNVDFSNEFGDIICSTSDVDGGVQINLSVKFKKGYVPKEKWEDYVAFDRKLYNLLMLELPFMNY